jgi:hypothetical protein
MSDYRNNHYVPQWYWKRFLPERGREQKFNYLDLRPEKVSIADASFSPTKFIVSDHPVTLYNPGCFPQSKCCRGHQDPDIRLVGTHTIFPLSRDKLLILTNVSWVRSSASAGRPSRSTSPASSRRDPRSWSGCRGS